MIAALLSSLRCSCTHMYTVLLVPLRFTLIGFAPPNRRKFKAMEYSLYATCPNEIVNILAEEIEKIGGREIRKAYGVVYFQADDTLYYKAHLQLRTASRIFRIIKDVPAYSPTIIFDKLKRIRFSEFFSHTHPIKINVVIENKKGNVEGHLVGSKIREAITDSFLHFDKVDANLSSRDPKVLIKGYIHKNRLMLSIDTSLEALHRRGFRLDGHPAPLKETLAASLLMLCGYDGNVPFLDPMCGSGTIALEAAMIACNMAPLSQRGEGRFGFEYLTDFDPNAWKNCLSEVNKRKQPLNIEIFSRDINESYLEVAKQSFALAGVNSSLIKFEQKDFFLSKKPVDKGLLVANIPYGERLEEQDIDVDYLKALGKHLKDNFTGWRCGILMPALAPFQALGVKADKKFLLHNGKIKVYFLIFDIFSKKK
ncbi:MAG: hypothetical protein R3B45_06325 [Bdellovibrionota bacterium]